VLIELSFLTQFLQAPPPPDFPEPPTHCTSSKYYYNIYEPRLRETENPIGKWTYEKNTKFKTMTGREKEKGLGYATSKPYSDKYWVDMFYPSPLSHDIKMDKTMMTKIFMS